MKRIIDVQIGQVKAGKGKEILQSKAIGSCIVIIAYDTTKSIGALAHVMLPGRAPDKKAVEISKYVTDAIDAIVSKMSQLGSQKADIEAVLVGGGSGEVKAESEFGRGSKFTFALPLKYQESKNEKNGLEVTVKEKKTILLCKIQMSSSMQSI
jgi:chemotaxis protein CheD